MREAAPALRARGMAAWRRGACRPKIIRTAIAPVRADRLRALLQSSCAIGEPTSLLTLDLAAEVSVERGLAVERISDETIRLTLKGLGVGWRRTWRWLIRLEPECIRGSVAATVWSSWR